MVKPNVVIANHKHTLFAIPNSKHFSLLCQDSNSNCSDHRLMNQTALLWDLDEARIIKNFIKDYLPSVEFLIIDKIKFEVEFRIFFV